MKFYALKRKLDWPVLSYNFQKSLMKEQEAKGELANKVRSQMMNKFVLLESMF